MTFRRPLTLALALSLLAGAVALRADTIRWVVAGTDAKPTGQSVPLTPALSQAVRDAIASTQAVPAVTQPATAPVSQPAPPVPVPAVAMKLIPRGAAGLMFTGGSVSVSDKWLRADQRDPTAPGWTQATDPRGPDGITIKNAASAMIENVTVERCGQNIVLQGIGGDTLLRNVRSFDSWSLNSAAQFQGQGVYRENSGGALTIDHCVFDRNGWRPGLSPHTRDTYGHAVYDQRFSGQARISDTAFMRASNAGLQLRSAGSVRGCLIADCGTGLIAMGRGDTVEVSDTVIVGGHRYWTGSAWTGNTAVMSYAKTLRLRNVWIVAAPGQALADPAAVAAGEKSFNTACIALSSTYTALHPDWPDPHPQIECTNVHVFGWPGVVNGNPVTLNNKPLLNVPGLTYHPNPVSFDAPGLIQRVRSGQTGVAAAIAEVRAAAGVS